MKIISSAFKDEEKIPEKFTADGVNVNPELEINEIPSGTKSLVLIVDDPDVKRVVGYTWIHWILFDIPVSKNYLKINENSICGVSGKSTYQKKTYGGPNPPKGTGIHHYHFKVFAVNDFLKLPEMASLEDLMKEMERKILASAEIVGKYWRE